MKESKYSDFYLEICKYYGYEIKDNKFIKKQKIPEFEYFGKWKKGKIVNWGQKS
jgi:hypothetical protein